MRLAFPQRSPTVLLVCARAIFMQNPHFSLLAGVEAR